ncbi:protein KRBA1-like [Ctenodactylus gundi]
MPISFKDLAVRFSEEEWRLLEEGQREFYRDVMRENYETLVSVGTAELLPLSAFLSPVEAGRATGPGGCAGEGQGAPAGGGPQGQPQHSLHLTALVQLVKEIPEFLFGEVKGTEDSPKSGEASLDGEGACPEAAVAVETRPLQGLLNCLPDSPMSRPSLSSTPASSSSSSGLRGDGGQRSPLLISECDPAGTGTTIPEIRGLEPCALFVFSLTQFPLLLIGTGVPGMRHSLDRGLERHALSFPTETADRPWPAEKESPGASGTEPGTPTYSPSQRKSHQRPERGTMGTGVSPGSSPLQGLINCLKEILVPGPQHPDAAPSSLPPPPSLGVARQTSRELQLGRPPWPVKTEAASGDCPLQGLLNCLKEIPEAQDRRPTSSGAGHARVQEDPQPWQRNSGGSGPLQTLLQLAGPGAGSVLTMVKVEDSWAPSPPMPTSCQLSRPGHSPSATRDPRGVHVPSWDPEAQVCRASSSPLEALEACLKGIPSSTLSPPQPLATSWSRSPQPGDAGYQRPGLRPQGPHGEEASREPLPPLGLQSCVRDGQGPVGLPGSQSTPTGFSSASSTDGDLDFGSPCRSQGQRPRKGYPPGNSPLQGLENCLREIPLPRLQPARVCPSAADRGPWRVEPRSWVAHKEGAAATPSPLHCLESSLREILPVRPLHFACLASPGPSLGPSPGSSSSLSSSDGEDPRLEPELWQLAPQGEPAGVGQ